MNFETALNQAKEIAKNGTKEAKESFVNWACLSINYLSEQLASGCGNEETKKALNAVKSQYKAYLEVISNED